MLAFLTQRLLQIIPTLILVSMLIFGLQQLLPGDPALIMAGEERDPAVLEEIRQQYRLNEPIPIQYFYWIKGVLSGNLGESMRLKASVASLVGEKLPVTLQLAAMAIVVALGIGIPAGIISAVKKDTAWDYGANIFALWGISTPNFWLGILMIFLFSVTLGWLPASGYVRPGRGLARQPRHHGDAGLRAGQRHRRRPDAPHAQRHAAGDGRRLRPDRPRQGPL